MKRALEEDPATNIHNQTNKIVVRDEGGAASEQVMIVKDDNSVDIPGDILFQILKHVDCLKTLGIVECVSKHWNKAARDKRLWELVCMRHWGGADNAPQLKSAVRAYGGFRRFHSVCVNSRYSSELYQVAAEAEASKSFPSTH